MRVKVWKTGMLTLLLLLLAVNLWAFHLSVNGERFIVGEELCVTLEKDWDGLADVWIAVELPGGSLFFMTPEGFFLDPKPYAIGVSSGGLETLLDIPLWPGLPYGTYTFYAAAFRHGSFFEELASDSVSFVLALEREEEPLYFNETSFPDGVVGRRYSFVLSPINGEPPYTLELLEGELPPGLELDPQSGAVEGEPTERGVWHVKIRVTDALGNTGEFEGDIRVFGILTVGSHGTYQGCNGLQMALNAAQDLDEIRLEQGVYECTGLILTSKNFEYGIKISGGWDATFESRTEDPSLTVLRGDAEVLSNLTTRELCEEAGGWWSWDAGRCFAQEPSGTRILTIESGPVTFENLTFEQGYSSYGGAVSGHGTFTNCSFTNNSAGNYGGAVSGDGTFTNCSFTNNSAGDWGGAVSGHGTFTNCSFTNNSAGNYGGAVCNYSGDSVSLINCTFYGNEAGDLGGAAYVEGTILNSIFYGNTAAGTPQDFAPRGDLSVDYSLFNYPSGGYDHGPHNIMGDPRFVDPESGDLHLRSDSPVIDMGDSSVLTACREYFYWGEEGCDETCRETCEDRWSSECRARCCECKVYTYPFLRDENGQPLDFDGLPRVQGESIDMGAYEYQGR